MKYNRERPVWYRPVGTDKRFASIFGVEQYGREMGLAEVKFESVQFDGNGHLERVEGKTRGIVHGTVVVN